MIQLLAIVLKDELLEKMRRNFYDAIRELQLSLGMQMTLIEGVELADGVATPVPHFRGRPVRVFPSAIRNAGSAGYISEDRGSSATYRRDQYVVLTANGYTNTITVDLLIV